MNLVQLLDYLDTFKEPISILKLEEALRNFIPQENDIRKHVRFNNKNYQRNDLRSNQFYEALLLCWMPKQCSNIHDHKGSSCGVYVIQGTMTEVPFKFSKESLPIELTPRKLQEGEVCASIDEDTHEIRNEDTEKKLITLHIYTPPLRKIGMYKRGSSNKKTYDFTVEDKKNGHPLES